MRKLSLLLILVMFPVMILSNCGGGEESDLERFSAVLSGSEETPPVNTPSDGNAVFFVENSDLRFEIHVRDISQIFAAHIHAGPRGVAGPILVTLYSGPQTGTVNGKLIDGTLNNNNLSGITLDQLLAQMRGGNTYVNVHTVQNPDGEIRGQIIPLD